MKLAWSRTGGTLSQDSWATPLLRAQPVCTGRGALTCDLCLRGEMLGLLRPGGGMDGHAPVTPRADVVVFGRHLDDVLLASIGIRDGVRCPVRQLDLRAAAGRGGRSEEPPAPGGVKQSARLARPEDDNDTFAALWESLRGFGQTHEPGTGMQGENAPAAAKPKVC